MPGQGAAIRWHTITIVGGSRTLHIFDFVPCVDDESLLA
jgi:hypothetical protein